MGIYWNTKPNIGICIDAVNACNINCPSCPTGRKEHAGTADRLEPDLLRKILDKATQEANVQNVMLFRWGEPTMHPYLGDLVAIVHSYNLPCRVSTNATIETGFKNLVKSNPDVIVISLSGWHQEVYQRTHTKGNVETVKANLRWYSNSEYRFEGQRLIVTFHRYKDNLDDEEPWREFCSLNDFDFIPIWAIYQPVDKLIDATIFGEPDKSFEQCDKLLAIDPVKYVKKSRWYPFLTCTNRETYLQMDTRGNVYLCAQVPNQPEFCAGNYLEHSIQELWKRKRDNDLCRHCQNSGVQTYLGEYSPFTLEHAKQRIPEHHYHRIKKVGGRLKWLEQLVMRVRRKNPIINRFWTPDW